MNNIGKCVVVEAVAVKQLKAQIGHYGLQKTALTDAGPGKSRSAVPRLAAT
jgi:hypothetical protein